MEEGWQGVGGGEPKPRLRWQQREPTSDGPQQVPPTRIPPVGKSCKIPWETSSPGCDKGLGGPPGRPLGIGGVFRGVLSGKGQGRGFRSRRMGQQRSEHQAGAAPPTPQPWSGALSPEAAGRPSCPRKGGGLQNPLTPTRPVMRDAMRQLAWTVGPPVTWSDSVLAISR